MITQLSETKSSAIADKPSKTGWAGFCDVYLPLTRLTPSMNGIPLSNQVHIRYRKTRMAGQQSCEGRMMIDSVVWAQYINDRQTDRHRHHSRCHANALRQAAKN